jgi:hypothetical protein
VEKLGYRLARNLSCALKNYLKDGQKVLVCTYFANQASTAKLILQLRLMLGLRRQLILGPELKGGLWDGRTFQLK